MKNKEIIRTAMIQLAVDANCLADDFMKTENVIVESVKTPKARKYLELPFICNLISYGNNIVASIDKTYEDIVREYIDKYSMEHCFETPNMHVFNESFRKYDKEVCFMAEYFLPDMNIFQELPCQYEMRVLEQNALKDLYLPQWGNALCETRKELDILGVGAYDRGRLIGLAACSADCDTMWQIGIDVLPEYRRQGIACAVTSKLAGEVLKREKVPFYCCAWSNIKSVKNALKSGFRPAWIEMTVKEKAFIDQMNKKKK